MTPHRIFLSVPTPALAELPVGGRFGAVQVIVDQVPDNLAAGGRKPVASPRPSISKGLVPTVEAAEFLGFSAKRLLNKLSDGTLPAALWPIRIGERRWAWDLDRMKRWIDENGKLAEQDIHRKS